MEPTERLTRALIHREALNPDWYKHDYEAALARIEDHTNANESPYWFGPTAGFDALSDEPVLSDETGTTYDPETVRKIAFELLVLADLAQEE
jgi:hypothetical protein